MRAHLHAIYSPFPMCRMMNLGDQVRERKTFSHQSLTSYRTFVEQRTHKIRALAPITMLHFKCNCDFCLQPSHSAGDL